VRGCPTLDALSVNDQMKRRARCYCGDGNKWRLIYEANAKEIADVKDLPVGQVLIIPILTDAAPPPSAPMVSKS